MTTNDDRALIAALEAAGHQDVAKAMRTKGLAAELRELGRDDVADRLEAGRNGGSAPLFGGSEEGDVAAVAAALKRDLGEDR